MSSPIRSLPTSDDLLRMHTDLVRARYRPYRSSRASLLYQPNDAMYEKGFLRIWFRWGRGPAVSITHLPTFDRWANSRDFIVPDFYPINILDVLKEARRVVHERGMEYFRSAGKETDLSYCAIGQD